MWPPEDILVRIMGDFPEESPETILALLMEYKGSERPRISRCILHLARGSIDQLLHFIGSANVDYRDVIYIAEYSESDSRVHDFSQPFSNSVTSNPGLPSSHIGGRPFMDVGTEVPSCTICSTRMCFFFQILMPADHRWSDSVVAVFHCVNCCSEESLIPEMLSDPLKGAAIPQGFLKRYQSNFRIVVADRTNGEYRREYDPMIQSSPIDSSLWRVGGEPEWVLDDETPASYGAHLDPVFLFQVPSGMLFPTCATAPPQKTLDLESRMVDADGGNYELFLGNMLYLFGFGAPASDHVYVVTQVE